MNGTTGLVEIHSFFSAQLTLTKVSTALLATSNKVGLPPRKTLWFMEAEVSNRNTIMVIFLNISQDAPLPAINDQQLPLSSLSYRMQIYVFFSVHSVKTRIYR
jgi:hypothetical protein